MDHMHLANLCRRRDGVESRSISAENPTGERGKGAMAEPDPQGAARELGRGWKCRPCLRGVEPGQTVTLMDVEGSGVIRHIWITATEKCYRSAIVRMYWDDQEHPSVQAPLGDLFCCSWNARQEILSMPVNVNPSGGMNMFFPMPFRRRARITVENVGFEAIPSFFYTIDYTLEDVADDALAFHATWRRANPLPYKEEYCFLDGVEGQGQYVGVFMSWQQNNMGWWGEGEVKMYLDGDGEFPTICGTGTEDYFGGAWNFRSTPFSAPFFGFREVQGKNEVVGARMTLYRFHCYDPVYFQKDFRATIQALGWGPNRKFSARQDDIASVAYWYQTLPGRPQPEIPGLAALEIV